MPDLISFDGVSASARTEGQLLAILEKIDLAVHNLLTSPGAAGLSYRIGDREVDRDGYLQWLLEARRTYERQLAALPAWEATRYDDPDL